MGYPPAVSDFQGYFTREFPYGTTPDTVMPADIQRALNEAASVFSTQLWSSASETQMAYLYASAHFLQLNLQAAGGLLSTPTSPNSGAGLSASGRWGVDSKSVGSVSLTNAIPDRLKQDPIQSQFLSTAYGVRYLTMLAGRMVGNIFTVSGLENDPSSEAAAYSRIPALAITTLALTAGTHNVAYSAALLAVGGLSPLTWSVSSGTLPTGVTLSAAGALAGTPTTAGTSLFSVTVTDARNVTATQQYALVIA